MAGDALTCSSCESLLEIIDTHSGGRTVSVVWLGGLIESCPDGVERFQFGSSQRIVCPACSCSIDPSKTYRSGIPRLRRIA